MSRPYSEPFLLALFKADENSLGVQLGRLCVQANLPASYIAVVLEVSRITVYNWFRAKDIRDKNKKSVETLIDLMKRDMEAGVLPAKTRIDAKMYLENLSGLRI
jgi:hypothetical protein